MNLKHFAGRHVRNVLGQVARHSPLKSSRFGYPDKILESAPWLKPGTSGARPDYVSSVQFLPGRPVRTNAEPRRIKDTDPILAAADYRWKPNPRYAVTLKNARVCRGLDIIGPDQNILWELSFRWNVAPAQHPLLRYPVLPAAHRLAGRTLYLCVDASGNYFHWLLDLLPKFKVLEDCGVDFLGFDYYLVYSLEKEFQRETLRRWGIDLDKVVETVKYPNLETETLTVPSLADQSGFFEAEDVRRVREVLLAPENGSNGRFPKRFFIDRRKTGGRRVGNWEQLYAVLDKHDVKPVELESLSFPEQIQLFHQAEAVMGVHGAGLTNLLFCEPGTRVLELVSPNWQHWMYWNLASSLRLDYHYMFGEASGLDEGNNAAEALRRLQDLNINTEVMERTLTGWA